MTQRYFLTDLDGTLLRSNATLSERTIFMINQALLEGLHISYATARSYISSHQIVSVIPWKDPLILYNGAILFDPVTEKVIDGSWLDLKIVDEIIQIGRARQLLPLLFALDHADHERVLHEKLTRYGDLKFVEDRPDDPRFEEITHLVCPDNYRTLILTYIGYRHELEPLREEVIQRLGSDLHIHFMKDQYIEDHYFLEFSHPDANKGEGLKKWARYMQCEPEDITVFGDNLNDVGMFEAAGKKVAVSNAHQTLLDIADDVTGSNDEDGVAAYIQKRISNDMPV
ncbi:haloacid dehalogenase [Paenibacillus selenitireducens]|uniref:Haloacid dehalogenase n=1 Tax=Paenibacillus selenitireducens TaxID=1324314 RepID=A0A1T2X1M7_9BACL|nr:Cof-type HAD-IIB family hydrolase [Paenibacillus selenitireducens]OPA73747.1 haloacid dehalogenase [Paenibacillus selenitireducens]